MIKKSFHKQSIFIFILIGILLITYFLPFVHLQEKEITAYGTFQNLSLFDYFRFYNEGTLVNHQNRIEYTVLFTLPFIFSLLLVVLTYFQKPVLIFLLNALLCLMICAIAWDFVDRKIISDGYTNFDYAKTLYYICNGLIAINSISLLVLKRKAKSNA